MASIFLSHSSKNNAWASKLQSWLEAKHHRSLFLDFDREAGFKAGDLWERQLYAKLRQCQVVLALVSRDWLDSRWCFAEAVLAREKGKRLILACIDEIDASTLFRDVQHLDFTGDEADAFARLEAALVDVFDLQPDREPYPGLVPFDERDAGVFVGREPETAALLEALESMRLRSRSGGERLLILLGASGSGKSSLVRAGALPRLRRLPERWQLLPPMRPGQDPVRELALCLAAVPPHNMEVVTGRLAASDQGGGGPLEVLADEVRLRAGQPEATVLLVLDQMEELLGLSEAQARRRFLDLVRQVLEHGDGRFLVLTTLRSEYLGEVQLLPFLTTPGPLPYREQTLDPVPLDRLDAIIREPGRRWPQPVEFADRLVERIARDTGTRDALPLLAFTLNRLWRDTPARTDGVFQLEEYERLGGLDASLRTAADEALDLRRRTPIELKVLRETFVPGLVRVDAAGVRTRRRAFLADFAPTTRGLLKRFVDQRLLVTNGDPEGRESVEVAHEALLRTWPQLDTWLAEDQDELRLLDGLERAARDWEVVKRSPELLAHRGARLAEVLALLDQQRFRHVIGETERRYLDASGQAEAERSRQERDEQERRVRDAERIADEQRKVAQRTRMGALVAVVLAAVAFGGFVIARQQQGAAEKQSALALSRQWAMQANNEIGRAPQLAFLFGAAGYRAVPTYQVREVLQRTLLAQPEVRTFLSGHQNKVRSVAFSPDGKTLASASDDQTVILWDVAGRKPLGEPLKGHQGWVFSVAFSRDGQMLASGSSDKSVILWDALNRKPLGEPLKAHQGTVRSVALSRDGKTLASASDDQTVILWDVAGRKPLGEPLKAHQGTVRSVAFSPDGEVLASGGWDGTVILWDVAGRKPLGEPLGRHSNGANSVAFSPDGKTLASAGGDMVILWDVAGRKRLGELLKGQGGVNGVTFSPDGKMLASAGLDRSVILWDVESRMPLREPVKGHEEEVVSVAFSSDSKTLASASYDHKVILWDVTGSNRLSEPLKGHQDAVYSVAFSPDGEVLASAGSTGRDGTVILWDVAARKPLGEPLKGHQGKVLGVVFSPDGKTLASASEDWTVILWDVANRTSLGEPLKGHQNEVLSVAFSPDGKTLASGSWDGTVILWDVAGRKPLDERLNGHQKRVWSVAFSPDGKTLASAGSDGAVILWNVANRKALGEPLKGHNPIVGALRSVAFSPDGKTFASASWDTTLILWDVASRKPAGEPLKAHLDTVNSAAFSPDGKTLASASFDHSVILWDVASRKPLGEPLKLKGYQSDLRSVAFSRDGKTLASASAGLDGTLLWDVDMVSWVRKACAIANRNLTYKEWAQYVGDDVPYQAPCPELPMPEN